MDHLERLCFWANVPLLFSLLSLTFRLLDFHSIQFREILGFDSLRDLHRTITSQFRIQNLLHMIILLFLYHIHLTLTLYSKKKLFFTTLSSITLFSNLKKNSDQTNVEKLKSKSEIPLSIAPFIIYRFCTRPFTHSKRKLQNTNLKA